MHERDSKINQMIMLYGERSAIQSEEINMLSSNLIILGEIYYKQVREKLEKGISNINDALADLGFAFSQIQPEFNIDEENSSIELILNITQGSKNYIEVSDRFKNKDIQVTYKKYKSYDLLNEKNLSILHFLFKFGNSFVNDI